MIVSGVGRLTRDAEEKKVGEFSLAKLSIASDRRVKRKGEWTKEASFYDCDLWGKAGLIPYLKKGTQVFIVGELVQDSWEKDGKKYNKLKIDVQQIELLGGKKDNASPAPVNPPNSFKDDNPFDDSSIPF
jgi:single-strand DNA-binding protein